MPEKQPVTGPVPEVVAAQASSMEPPSFSLLNVSVCEEISEPYGSRKGTLGSNGL